MYLICKHLEHSDVSCLQGRRPGAHEENAEGGEAEVARGLSGSLTLVEDADTTMAAVANFRDITLVYEVQSSGKCAEFHAVKLYIQAMRMVGILERDVSWGEIPSVMLRDQSENDLTGTRLGQRTHEILQLQIQIS